MLRVFLLMFLGLMEAHARNTSFLCNETHPLDLPWVFHCFDGEHCLTADLQACQTNLPSKCPDGSDHNQALCNRVVLTKFHCCDHRSVGLKNVCDGVCDCVGCDDEDVCRERLKCNWAASGMSIGTIIAITLGVFLLFMVMVLCAVCFFCFKCADGVRGWQTPEHGTQRDPQPPATTVKAEIEKAA